jgi:dTDP-4-amino-4,6-dideoxygalactose transaminase
MRLSKSVVGIEEANALSRIILEDGYLGMGSEVNKFEAEIAEFLKIDRACVIAVNTGTAALHLALEALDKPGKEVLVPSLTYVATYQAIKAAGMQPISCDVDADSWTIDLNDISKKITENTVAIIPVHYASNIVDLDELKKLALQHNLTVIEDAAHAFGCKYKNQFVGSTDHNNIVCFSFDGIKNITCGEGGAVVTKNVGIQKRIQDSRLLGVINDTEQRYVGGRSWEFEVTNQGYRYHMSNLMACIGRVQLKKFEAEFSRKRIFLSDLYRSKLSQIRGIELQRLNSSCHIIPHIMPIVVQNAKRNFLKEELEKIGIPTGIHYKPNHLLKYFADSKVALPVTEKLYTELLTLPLHPELEEKDILFICESIKSILN